MKHLYSNSNSKSQSFMIILKGNISQQKSQDGGHFYRVRFIFLDLVVRRILYLKVFSIPYRSLTK